MDSRRSRPPVTPVQLVAAVLALALVLPVVGLHGGAAHGHESEPVGTHQLAAGPLTVASDAVHGAEAPHLEASTVQWLEACGWCARLARSSGLPLATPRVQAVARGSGLVGAPFDSRLARRPEYGRTPGRAPPHG